METQVEHKDFDFNNKKIEHVLEKKPAITAEKKKMFTLSAFVLLGAMAIGISFGLINNYSKDYLIEKEKLAKIEEIKVQNEELRKNELNKVAAKKQDLQNKIDIEKEQKKKALEEKISLEQEKSEYSLLIKNKDNLIANYEAQLTIYDKAYQRNIQAVKDGLMSLDDLTEVRSHYQQYKDDIHDYMKFIRDISVSFDTYSIQDSDNKIALEEELKLYQSGGLHRSSNLENVLLSHVGDDSNDDEDDEKLANMRKNARNNIIDDMADIVKIDNVTTKTKKLKM